MAKNVVNFCELLSLRCMVDMRKVWQWSTWNTSVSGLCHTGLQFFNSCLSLSPFGMHIITISTPGPVLTLAIICLITIFHFWRSLAAIDFGPRFDACWAHCLSSIFGDVNIWLGSTGIWYGIVSVTQGDFFWARCTKSRNEILAQRSSTVAQGDRISTSSQFGHDWGQRECVFGLYETRCLSVCLSVCLCTDSDRIYSVVL